MSHFVAQLGGMTHICSLASYERKEKKNICCVWNSSWLLGGVLTGSWKPLDFSRRLLACSWLISFFQESASLLKNHQEANKKTSRSCWDAAKKHQDMSRSVTKCQEEEEVSRNFWKFQKISWSFPIHQEYWRSARKLIKKSPRSHQEWSRTQVRHDSCSNSRR